MWGIQQLWVVGWVQLGQETQVGCVEVEQEDLMRGGVGHSGEASGAAGAIAGACGASGGTAGTWGTARGTIGGVMGHNVAHLGFEVCESKQMSNQGGLGWGFFLCFFFPMIFKYLFQFKNTFHGTDEFLLTKISNM